MQRLFTHSRTRFILLIALIIGLVVMLGQNAQRQRFWSGCQVRAQGTSDRTWYQGAYVSFGFPSSWQSSTCKKQGYELKLLDGQPWWWVGGQPVGQTVITFTSQPQGAQTLPKTLAGWAKEKTDGQRLFDTVRIGTTDGLVRTQISTGHLFTQEVVIDQGLRRYIFSLTFQAVSDSQPKNHQLTMKSTESPLTKLVATISFQ